MSLRKVRADLHRSHALKAFRVIPWWTKLALPFLILFILLCAPFVNLRKITVEEDEACQCACEGGCENDEFFLTKLFKPVLDYILRDRDLFLRMVVAEELIDPKNAGKALCIKYGEKHMPALATTLLTDFGYVLAAQHDVLAVKKTKALDVSAIKTGYKACAERMSRHAFAWKERLAQDTKPEVISSTTLKAEFPTNFSLANKHIQYNVPKSYKLGKNSEGKTIKIWAT